MLTLCFVSYFDYTQQSMINPNHYEFGVTQQSEQKITRIMKILKESNSTFFAIMQMIINIINSQ